jgi:hypothetical protein
MEFPKRDIFAFNVFKRLPLLARNPEWRFYLALAFLVWSLLPHALLAPEPSFAR